ncbi:MAG: DUF2092 domain-containing protein [Azoarcus sp.]|nr:DUF2092 domain-containing protein [Azoarcus sp.]
MKSANTKPILTCATLAVACIPWLAFAQSVDPDADEVLRGMTTYMAGLKQFSAQTENTLEVVTIDGQKIQFTSPATVTVSRPDKLMAERRGDIVDQAFYYDGKTLTLYNPGTKYYATVPAPADVDAMLEFARTKLDIIAPGADLIDSRAYEHLMQDVRTGTYVGMATVGGHRCHHLAYRSVDVDWQVWVRDGKQAIPCKYVITSREVAGAPQFTVNVLQFDPAPKISDAQFRFVPPADAKTIEFMPVQSR